MDSVGIPNLFCSSIDSFVTGDESTVISPDKIFRISKRRACDFLDSSCGISGEVSFVIASGIGDDRSSVKNRTCLCHTWCNVLFLMFSK